MKNALAVVLVSPIIFCSHSLFADYVGLSMDWEIVDADQEMWKLMVYADFTSSTDELLSVFGDAESPLTIQSSNGFYQNLFGGNTSASINTAFFPFFPSLAWDSWVTIGYESTTSNNMNDIGIDWSDFESGGNLQVDNGAWFVSLDEPQAVAGDDLRVLVAQLTTFGLDSSISGTLNVFGRNDQGEFYSARNQYFGTLIPSPPMGALFLVSILLSKRRR